MNSDSFQVDMEHFSHLSTKDNTVNSSFTLQRSFSRKVEEKKMSCPTVDIERDAISSPKDDMSDKLIPITTGTDEQEVHQISIVTTTIATNGTPTKSRLINRRSNSFKQSSIINPRSIMFFFATLSIMGTILLIYFTLSMAKHNGDENLLD